MAPLCSGVADAHACLRVCSDRWMGHQYAGALGHLVRRVRSDLLWPSSRADGARLHATTDEEARELVQRARDTLLPVPGTGARTRACQIARPGAGTCDGDLVAPIPPADELSSHFPAKRSPARAPGHRSFRLPERIPAANKDPRTPRDLDSDPLTPEPGRDARAPVTSLRCIIAPRRFGRSRFRVLSPQVFPATTMPPHQMPATAPILLLFIFIENRTKKPEKITPPPSHSRRTKLSQIRLSCHARESTHRHRYRTSAIDSPNK